MSMRQMLNEFVKSIDQSDIGSNELFNMEMVVGKQNLFVYTSHLNSQQLDMILEHLASGIDVTLVTTKHVDESLKNRMSKELFSKKETTIKWERFIRIGYVILGIGVLMLGASVILHLNGNPITRENEVIRLILPLLELYLGFVISDFAYKQKYIKRPLHDHLKVEVFKKHRSLPKCYLYLTDNKRIIYQNIDSDKFGISHGKVIENPIMIQQLQDIADQELPLTKREGLTLTGFRAWLLG